MTENDEPKENDTLSELNKQLDKAEEQGKQLLDTGRNLTAHGQFMVDFSRSLRETIHVVGIPNDVENLIQDLESYNDNAVTVLTKLDGMELSTFESTAGTAAFTASGLFDPVALQHSIEQDRWKYVKPVIDNFQEVTSRIANKGQALKLMRDFNLELAPKGQKSSIELFETAHQAFEMPVTDTNPISTSLIPARESIRLAIDHLLAERPRQEPAGNERTKIKSIANQLKRDAISDQVIDSWIEQWDMLLNKYLSPAKDQEISREEWQYRLNHATLFIINLLTGLDSSKLRTRVSRSDN